VPPRSAIALASSPRNVSGDLASCIRPMRADSFELASAGSDPTLQLVGSDPTGGQSWSGLVVPSQATPDYAHRYLFMLAWLRLDANRRGKIRGVRTSVLLGATVASVVGEASGLPYPIEYELQNPFWKSPLGNYCFYLRRISTPAAQIPYNIDDGPSQKFQYANGPALLYQSFRPYVPPFAGVPPGVDLMPCGSWYDNRFGPWRDQNAWTGMDVSVQGPCDLALFCSLQQMPAVKAVPSPDAVGLPPDDAFLQNNPTAQFARVAGSFVWQEVSAR
jgi:hypothetical protein